MTGYIAEMRKIVGHKTLIQCAASIICVDKDGRILLGKRSDNKNGDIPAALSKLMNMSRTALKESCLRKWDWLPRSLSFSL